MLCGTFGCTLPDSHAGVHEVPAPVRARERRPTAKARDDSDSDGRGEAACGGAECDGAAHTADAGE
eukprot:5276474-Prymnesium_polylepis.1